MEKINCTVIVSKSISKRVDHSAQRLAGIHSGPASKNYITVTVIFSKKSKGKLNYTNYNRKLQLKTLLRVKIGKKRFVRRL